MTEEPLSEYELSVSMRVGDELAAELIDLIAKRHTEFTLGEIVHAFASASAAFVSEAEDPDEMRSGFIGLFECDYARFRSDRG